MRKFLSLVYIPSAIVLCIMLSTYSYFHFTLGVIIGLALGFAAFRLEFRPQYLQLCPGFFLTIILTVLAVSALPSIFFREWIVGPGIVRIFSRFGSSPEDAFGTFCKTASVVTIPIVYTTAGYLVKALFSILRTIRINRLLGNLRDGFSHLPKAALLYVCSIAMAALVGAGLMYAAFLIPDESIRENTATSAQTLRQEGFDPAMHFWSYSIKDSYTDALILSEASADAPVSTLEKAMLVHHGYFSTDSEKDPYDYFTEHHLDSKAYTGYGTYARYWHGFVVTLRPLLTFWDLHEIYILNGVVQTAMCIAVCLLLRKRGLSTLVAPFLISYLIMTPTMSMTVLQYATCCYVFMLGLLGILLLPRSNCSPFIFLIIGILTAFFDFLTFPIATFGVPAVVCIALNQEDEPEKAIAQMIKNGISWIFGFVGMWASKWILASVLTSENVILDALSAIQLRTSSTTGNLQLSAFACLFENYRRFFASPFTLLAIGFALMCLMRIRRHTGIRWKEEMAPYFILSLAPVVWYLATRNHSSIHSFFTNKACIVTVMALLCGLGQCARSPSK